MPRNIVWRVGAGALLAAGVMLLLFPMLARAGARNAVALELTRILPESSAPQTVCAISQSGTIPLETGCDDVGTCYLRRVRANLVGLWDARAAPAPGQDLMSAYANGYAAWCAGAPQEALAFWAPHQALFAHKFAALGAWALGRGDLTAAKDWYGVGVALAPSAEMYAGLGAVYQARGEPERALSEYERALQQDSASSSLSLRAAILALQLRQFARAQVYCERALAHEKSDWLLWQVYGNALSSQGLWAQAEEAYRHVLELNPTYSHGNAGLGLALARQGKFAEARPYFTNIIEYEPSAKQKAGYLAAYAALLAQSEDHVGAVEFYRRAAEFDPVNAGFAGALVNEFVAARDCQGLRDWLAKRRAGGYAVDGAPTCVP